MSAHSGLRKEIDQRGMFFFLMVSTAFFMAEASGKLAETAFLSSSFWTFRVISVIMPVVPIVPINFLSSVPEKSLIFPLGRTTRAFSILS